MGDHPDADAEEVEDRAHPLRVAPGEVVVDGHDVDAPAGQRVEDRGQRGHERLAFAGAHLRDPALVEHGPTDELDVEVAHAERPLHGLAGHREDFGQDVVEGLLEALVLALAPLLAQLAAALEVLVVQLVLGRLVRLAPARGSPRGSPRSARGSARGSAPRIRLRARSPPRPGEGSVGPRGRSSRRNGKGIAWNGEYTVRPPEAPRAG